MPLLALNPAGVFIVLAIIAFAYFVAAFPLYRVATLTSDHADTAWYAWVPVMSIILQCRIAGVNPWSAFVLLLGVIPGIGLLVSIGYTLILWVKIGRRFGHTGLGVLAGLLPIIGAWVFAFVAKPETAY